jgi:hypothetical protein
MLAVAIEGDYVSKVVLARKRDTGPQGRRLAAISWQLHASSTRCSGNLRRSIPRSIVNHYNICKILPSPFHNLADMRGFVECRD